MFVFDSPTHAFTRARIGGIVGSILGCTACVVPVPRAAPPEHAKIETEATTTSSVIVDDDPLPSNAVQTHFDRLDWVPSTTLAIARLSAPVDTQQDPKWIDLLDQAILDALSEPPSSPLVALPLNVAFALRQLPWMLRSHQMLLDNEQMVGGELAFLIDAQHHAIWLWPILDESAQTRIHLEDVLSCRALVRPSIWRFSTCEMSSNRGADYVALPNRKTLAWSSADLKFDWQAFQAGPSTGTSPLSWAPEYAKQNSSAKLTVRWTGQQLMEQTSEAANLELPIIGELTWTSAAGIHINGQARTSNEISRPSAPLTSDLDATHEH